uniref:Uncharacterized protein n=1 Tax=Sinocyclocheilus grahami TaxID=75366 RepID=A0A672Q0D2_SINGR
QTFQTEEEFRKQEVVGIRTKFPTKIPVRSAEKHLPPLDKTKFLVPQELTMSQFVSIIRSLIKCVNLFKKNFPIDCHKLLVHLIYECETLIYLNLRYACMQN